KAPGGNSIISDGGLAAAGTPLQSRHGIHDSAEIFYRDMLRAGQGLVLAAGSFGADVAFRSVQDPRLGPDLDTTNKPSATAEVLSAALRLGASGPPLRHTFYTFP
ncbi:MAG: hypothetical protein AB7T74_17445, partial [Clostridia bacterium]